MLYVPLSLNCSLSTARPPKLHLMLSRCSLLALLSRFLLCSHALCLCSRRCSLDWLYTLPTIAPLRTGVPPMAKTGLLPTDRLLFTSPHAVLEAEAP